MRTRPTLLAGTAAVTLALTGSLALAPSATASDHVLRLTARSSTSSLFIPCPTCVLASQPSGAHIGGVQIDAGDLRDQAGRKVGHYALQSVGVSPFSPDGPGELALAVTLVIGHDQLTASGLEEPPLVGGMVAITGGTGRYLSARGEIRYRDDADGATTLDVSLVG